MAQSLYSAGSFTNGSAVVTDATATFITDGLAAGDGVSVTQSGVSYDIGSVDSETQITLTAPYAGTTDTGVEFVVWSDFTSPDNIPELSRGDVETATIFTRAMRKLQDLITGIKTGIVELTSVLISGGSISGVTLGADVAFESVGQALSGPTSVIKTKTFSVADDYDPSWVDKMAHTSWEQSLGKFPSDFSLTLETSALHQHDTNDGSLWKTYDLTGLTCYDVTYHNGRIYLATSNGLVEWDFPQDKTDDIVIDYSTTTTPAIVNDVCNAVAVTALDGAPLNYVGLPVNTVAVGTDGGVSVIDGPAGVGTVVDITGFIPVTMVSMSEGVLSVSSTAANDYIASGLLSKLTADISYTSWRYVQYTDVSIPAFKANGGGYVQRNGSVLSSHGTGAVGICRLFENPATPASGMVAYITNAYNTGYQVGDSRLACLCDTTTGTRTTSTNDYSVKGNTLNIMGTLTATALGGTGSLAAWSGFDASNYIEQPYTADLDFGTGDAYIRGWFNTAATIARQTFLHRRDVAGTGGGEIQLRIDATTSYLTAYISDDNGSTIDLLSSSTAYDDGMWHSVELAIASGVLYLFVDNVQVSSTPVVQAALGISNATAVTRIGGHVLGTNPANVSSLALWKVSATVPSAEQRAETYRTEKAIIDGQACVLPGASSSVLGLDYNAARDELTVTQADYVSTFRDLVRVDSVASQVGTLTSAAADRGALVQGGSTGGYLTIDALNIKEELTNDKNDTDELEPQWFTGDGSTTDFALTQGWKPKYVHKQGLLMREGSSYDYTISNDGFIQTVVFNTAPLLDDNICILARRA